MFRAGLGGASGASGSTVWTCGPAKPSEASAKLSDSMSAQDGVAAIHSGEI